VATAYRLAVPSKLGLPDRENYNRPMAISLTARERSHLKARAHSLEPVVRVGQGGLSDTLVAEVDRALSAHELVKIRLDEPDRHRRKEQGEVLSSRTDSAIVQRVGKMQVLWRQRPHED
jgi:RNA-binding protein